MPPKKEKKGKKAPAAPVDTMPAFDRQYYELTIVDLNQKLAHLRSHNATLEQTNEEIEERTRQFQEDRSDVTAYLDRTLKDKTCVIQNLEERLTELEKVRRTETVEFQRLLKEAELKFKTMQDELSSENKLLTGKLNSIEEFRIQKDELLAKFDQQETELRVQTKQHRDLIYEIERKQVMDKDRMKREVENKLLQLSNEFAKSNEIRISAHVQRLVRENIALNNELDRMMFSQRRLQQENKDMFERDADRRSAFAVVSDENAQLIRRNNIQLEIINELTEKNMKIEFENGELKSAKRSAALSKKLKDVATDEATKYRHKMRKLEQMLHAVRVEATQYHTVAGQKAADYDNLLDVLVKLKYTVRSAVRGEQELVKDDPKFRAAQRKHLLDELVEILMSVEPKKDAGPTQISSFETIGSVHEMYKMGDLGFAAPGGDSGSTTVPNLPEKKAPPPMLDTDGDGSSYVSVKTYHSWPIIDLETGTSALVLSESSKGGEGPGANDEEGLEDDEEDLGESSSDDAQKPPS